MLERHLFIAQTYYKDQSHGFGHLNSLVEAEPITDILLEKLEILTDAVLRPMKEKYSSQQAPACFGLVRDAYPAIEAQLVEACIEHSVDFD